MKNKIKKMFSDALAQPLDSIAADGWEPQTEAENEKQFREFLRLLTANKRPAAFRLGRRMIAAHLGIEPGQLVANFGQQSNGQKTSNRAKANRKAKLCRNKK